jgi:hypothetical protein
MGHTASGSFITRDQITALNQLRTTNVLSSYGLQVVAPRRPGEMSSIRSRGGFGCMRIVIDGVRFPDSAPPDIDSIPTEFIEGIEIYRDRQGGPPQYLPPFDNCGAILIWTSFSR